LKKPFITSRIEGRSALKRLDGREREKRDVGGTSCRKGIVIKGGECAVEVIEEVVNEIFTLSGVNGHVIGERLEGGEGGSWKEDRVK
jgi:hypothetical protein